MIDNTRISHTSICKMPSQ